jgi:outer membrane protein TolC
MAVANKDAARDTELPVQRFQADIRKNQSEKLIVKQEIIETENRINFLLGRYPQPVPRPTKDFIHLNLNALNVGMPSQLLQNRPDIRQAERELQAAGLDVLVARARFYPQLTLTGGVGYEAFNARYLFVSPQALVANAVGDLVTPLINKRAIQADYKSANAMQLQAIYDYQRTVLDAFTEVINRMSKVENYRQALEIKMRQLEALELAVEQATQLFFNARAEYIDVLFVQRDYMEARMVVIETKRQQLAAVVAAYQALGGGLIHCAFNDPSFDLSDPSAMGPMVTPPAPDAPHDPPLPTPDIQPTPDAPDAPTPDAPDAPVDQKTTDDSQATETEHAENDPQPSEPAAEGS